MRLAVIGSGYVGTVTGACMAEMGHTVVCADVDSATIERLQQGKVDFYEEGLEAMINTNLKEGRLSFTNSVRSAALGAEVIYLCMGTKGAPADKPDMKPLQEALKDITAAMAERNDYVLIVEKSTLPIKSGDELRQMIQAELAEGCGCAFNVAAVPQFLREGNAIHDFFHPDRIVIGAEVQKAKDVLVQLYTPLGAPLLITDISSAEMIKHAANAFLAMKISFINSIAQICEKTGADVTVVSKGLGMDKRISPDFLNAGIGYGGIFFPKDINALLNIADQYHLKVDLLRDTEVVNKYQRINYIERIEKALGGVSGKTISLWGLAYRPNTDDMREAPSLHIIRGLVQRGAKIRAFDPIANEKTRAIFPKITYCESPYEAAEGADGIAILTEWPEFAYIDFTKLKECSNTRTIVDGRNLFAPQKMRELGYTYWSIGREPVKQAVPAGV